MPVTEYSAQGLDRTSGPDEYADGAEAAPNKVKNEGQPDPADKSQGPDDPAAGGDAYESGAYAVDNPPQKEVAGPEEAISAGDTQAQVDSTTVGGITPFGGAPEQKVDEALDGTVDEVKDWIGDDPERAQAVLDKETGEDGQNRKGVISAAEAVLNK